MSVLSKVLPWIGATAESVATGNPVPILSKVAEHFSAITGKKVTPDADSFTAALAGATPDQLVAMKKEDDDYALQMQALGFKEVTDLATITASDRASARDMQKQTRSITPTILAYLSVLELAGCIYLLAFYNLSVPALTAISLLTGAVVASYKDVYGYFFGSSAGQDAQLANGGNGSK